MYLIDIEITESLDKPQQYSLNKKGKRGFQSINKNNEIIQVCVTLVSLVSRLFFGGLSSRLLSIFSSHNHSNHL